MESPSPAAARLGEDRLKALSPGERPERTAASVPVVRVPALGRTRQPRHLGECGRRRSGRVAAPPHLPRAARRGWELDEEEEDGEEPAAPESGAK